MGDLEQHFLTDPEALAWIVAELDPRPGERVVELGAGAGTIALALSRTVAPADLTLVELDARLAAGLRARFAAARVLAEDWLMAWRRLPPPDVLVVSLPRALVPAALAAAADGPPRVAVVAVAADDPPRLPSGLVLTATRPLPRRSFEPPQPFDGAAWIVRPAGLGPDGRRTAAR
ncbi:MAG: rRNA adenine N-6-methyltransferase family protein [Trueperaceae bacterium]